MSPTAADEARAPVGAPQPLGNPDVSVAAAMDAARVRRWVLRERARGLQPVKGPACCGTHALTGQLSLARRGERWAPSGLLHCAMVWLCPVCAARVGQRRAEEIAEGVRRWQASGGTVLLITWTLAHRIEDALSVLLGVFTKARAKMRSRKEWGRLRAAVGWEGDVRNWEVTWGAWNGWHPHQHQLVFCRPPPSWFGGVEFLLWWRRLENLWANVVEAVSPQHRPGDGDRIGVGVRVDVVGHGLGEDAAGYITKDLVHGAAMEVARPDSKAGRPGRMSPWELQERAVDGHARERELWAEYAAATRNRHRVRWSPGTREQLGLRVRTDEELAHEEGEADETEDLDDDESALLLWCPEVTPQVLEAAERDGPAGAHALLAVLLAVLTSLERAQLRVWAKDRVGLAGRWSRVRRTTDDRAPPGDGVGLWASGSVEGGTPRPVRPGVGSRRTVRARAAGRPMTS